MSAVNGVLSGHIMPVLVSPDASLTVVPVSVGINPSDATPVSVDDVPVSDRTVPVSDVETPVSSDGSPVSSLTVPVSATVLSTPEMPESCTFIPEQTQAP